MSFLRELWHYVGVRKKFWLLPVLAAMGLLGGLLVLLEGSALGPFMYTIF